MIDEPARTLGPLSKQSRIEELENLVRHCQTIINSALAQEPAAGLPAAHPPHTGAPDSRVDAHAAAAPTPETDKAIEKLEAELDAAKLDRNIFLLERNVALRDREAAMREAAELNNKLGQVYAAHAAQMDAALRDKETNRHMSILNKEEAEKQYERAEAALRENALLKVNLEGQEAVNFGYAKRADQAERERDAALQDIDELKRLRAMYAAATEIQGNDEVLKYVTSCNAVPVTRCTVSADLIRQLVSGRDASLRDLELQKELLSRSYAARDEGEKETLAWERLAHKAEADLAQARADVKTSRDAQGVAVRTVAELREQLADETAMREQAWIDKGIAALQDQLGEALKDAERYRWLRKFGGAEYCETASTPSGNNPGIYMRLPSLNASGTYQLMMEMADAVIDSYRSAT